MTAERPGRRVLVDYQDGAGSGQQGTITRVRAGVGTRLRAVRQTRSDLLYVYPAPRDRRRVRLVAPQVNTGTTNVSPAQFARELPPGVHAVMVLDRAGWHTAGGLRVPPNVTLVHRPPKSPEPNPVGNPWRYRRSHDWANRLYAASDDLRAAATGAWRHGKRLVRARRAVRVQRAHHQHHLLGALVRPHPLAGAGGRVQRSGGVGVRRGRAAAGFVDFVGLQPGCGRGRACGRRLCLGRAWP